MKNKNSFNIPHSFYVFVLLKFKEVAAHFGYDLYLIRDKGMDFVLIAIPFSNKPFPEENLVMKLDEFINVTPIRKSNYKFSALPGGKSNYIIDIIKSTKWEFLSTGKEYYLSIIFTPLVIY